MNSIFEIKEGYAILHIRAHPNSGRNEIVGVQGEVIKVRLKAPPVDGAANEELIGFFSKEFKIPKSEIEILSGETNKNKKIKVALSKKLRVFLDSL